MAIIFWANVQSLPSRSWTCGHCGIATGNEKGFADLDNRTFIYLCPGCSRPTFFQGDNQVPGASFGNTVGNLPPDIESLYQEIRNCMVVSAYTSCVLTARKILMHIAVEKKATPGQTFQDYVKYLVAANVIPGHFTTWVDNIRTRSNEANHEIKVMTRKDAEDLLSFTEMLLKVLYEYPNRASKATATGS